MSEIKTIKDVQHVLQRVPKIHAGGCGVAALAISRWICKSNMRASTVFVFGHRDRETYDQNHKAEMNSNNKPGSASHIGVIIYDYYNDKQMIIDANGTYDMTSYYYLNTIGNADFMLRSINQIGEWNDSFDRRHVERIAKELDIDLSDIDIRTKHSYLYGKGKFKSYKKRKYTNKVKVLTIEAVVSAYLALATTLIPVPDAVKTKVK